MYILAIVVGLLLVLFGGGCTLIMGGLVISDPGSLTNDLGMVLSIVLPLGVLPLAVGILLIRWGVKKDRERRRARARAPSNVGPEAGP
jgi:hypothetical protein